MPLTDNTGHLIKKVNGIIEKDPNLQIDILLSLTLRGKLSKGQAETILKKTHEDIIDSFDILEKKGLIEKNEKIYLEEEDLSISIKLQNGLEILIMMNRQHL